MTSIRFVAVVAVLALVACSNETPQAALSLNDSPASAPSPEEIASVKVQKFTITPSTVQAGQDVTVVVELTGIPGSIPITLAWFGPDGWLVGDQTRELSGHSMTLESPGSFFDEAGRYRAEVRSGLIQLGESALDVG